MYEKFKNIITCIQNNNIHQAVFSIKEINLPSNKIKPFTKGCKINLWSVKFLLQGRLALECDYFETVVAHVGSTYNCGRLPMT